LLHQLASITPAANAFTRAVRAKHDGEWEMHDLIPILREILSALSAECVFLMVDGLDECDETDQDNLLELILDLQHLDNVKICVSSRSNPRISAALCGIPHLTVQDLTAKDIEIYVSAMLGPCEGIFTHQTALIRTITSTMIQKADGNFSWAVSTVVSVLNGLEEGDDGELLRSRLMLALTDNFWKPMTHEQLIKEGQLPIITRID
jgi:hypothetical protein